jgi:hypothetical protein
MDTDKKFKIHRELNCSSVSNYAPRTLEFHKKKPRTHERLETQVGAVGIQPEAVKNMPVRVMFSVPYFTSKTYSANTRLDRCIL